MPPNPTVFVEDHAARVLSLTCPARMNEGRKIAVIVDEHMYAMMPQCNWNINNGYGFHKDYSLMHSFIWKLAGNPPLQPGQSIDHINWIKTDNRLANLRVATQSEQNSNRGLRDDKLQMPLELQAVLVGKDYASPDLPKYVRYDDTRDRFTFWGHPKHEALTAASYPGLPSCHGTQSSECTMEHKLHDCLTKYVKMLEMHRAMTGDDNDIDGFQQRRQKLLSEAIAIVNAANAVDPALYPLISLSDSIADPELELAQKLLAVLEAPPPDAIGRGKRAYAETQLEDEDVFVRDGVIVYDKTDHEVLQHFSWMDDCSQRIKMPKNESTVNAALKKLHAARPSSALPAIPSELKDARVTVSVFVASVLHSTPVPEGHCVVPINHEKLDVRARNLAIAAGESRSFKPPQRVMWPESLAGKIKYDDDPLPVIPRGLMVSEASNGTFLVYYNKRNTNGERKVQKMTASKPADVAKLVAKYMDYVKSDWPENSPFKGWKALDPEAHQALSSDWSSAYAYYADMVLSYKRICNTNES